MNLPDLSFQVTKALLESTTRPECDKPKSDSRLPFTITISREVGALGNSVAREVGRLLDWPVYDQEILNQIAAEVKRPSFELRGFDEQPANWLDTLVAGISSDYQVNPAAYLKYLIAVIRGLGKRGHCVLVGRAASQILPPSSTMRVRLVGSRDDRVRVVANRTGLSEREAVRWMGLTDQARLDFVKSNFKIDATDPHQYDLVLNTSRLSIASCARTIIATLRNRESESADVEHAPLEMSLSHC